MKYIEAKAAKDIPNTGIKKGDCITLTKGVRYKYALWCSSGIFDLPSHYVAPARASRAGLG